MVLGPPDGAILQRFERALPIEPRRGDEARDRPSGDLLDAPPSALDPCRCLGAAEPKELAFSRRQIASAKPVRSARVPPIVAVLQPMEEHLDPAVRPPPQACRKGR